MHFVGFCSSLRGGRFERRTLRPVESVAFQIAPYPVPYHDAKTKLCVTLLSDKYVFINFTVTSTSRPSSLSTSRVLRRSR